MINNPSRLNRNSRPATFNVRVSATPDVVDGGIIATITKAAGSGAELKANVGATFVPLTVPALIKITAANDNAEASCRIRSKTVTSRNFWTMSTDPRKIYRDGDMVLMVLP